MKNRKKWELAEFAIVLALILGVFFFVRPELTGMVVGETNQITREINKVFNQSSELNVSLEGNLTSLAVSGSYSGERVQIYLDELLVYSSDASGNNLIAGDVIGTNEIAKNVTDQTRLNITNSDVNQINVTESSKINQSSVNESAANTEENISRQLISFSNECEDTCLLENYPSNFALTIILDNATLNLTSVTYNCLKPESDEKQNTTNNVTNNVSKEISYTEFESSEVRVGQPVTWTKRVKDVDSVTLPASAYDIETDNEVKVISGNQKLSLEEFSQLKAGKRGDIRLEVKNNTQITFKTPGPQKTEKEINTYRKQVTISSDIHYRDVLTSTNIPESSKDSITLYWLKDGGKERVDDIAYIDQNDNGLMDEIEWTVPHLSNQSYEISIIILNPYTYLRDGETWTVAFNTTGTANLTITSPNAGWTEFLIDDSDTFDEMDFLDLKCGEESFKDELKLVGFDNLTYDYTDLTEMDSLDVEKLLVRNYECTETGYLSNYMHKAGYATLMFEFENQNQSVRDWAYDPLEIRYFRGDQHTVNSLTAYDLDTSQSSTAQSASGGWTGNGACGTQSWGIRVWNRSSSGTEVEVTSGTPVAQVSRSTDGSGIQSATWTPSQTGLSSSSSIVVRVYMDNGDGNGFTQKASFTTEQLNSLELSATQWTVNYYTERSTSSCGANPNDDTLTMFFRWGTTTYNSSILDFDYVSADNPPDVNEPITFDNTTLEQKSGFGPGDGLRVRANVTDNSGSSDISSTFIEITNTSGACQVCNQSMANITQISNGFTYEYNYTIPSGADLGTWNINIYSNDTSNDVGSNNTNFSVYTKSPSNAIINTYMSNSYATEDKFFDRGNVIFVQVNVTDQIGDPVEDAEGTVNFTLTNLEKSVNLSHFSGSLYRANWTTNSTAGVGVYNISTYINNSHGGKEASNLMHIYPGENISAYHLDWNEDGLNETVIENKHIIAVFNSTENSTELLIHMVQKDTNVSHSLYDSSDYGGKTELTTTNAENFSMYDFSLSSIGENLNSVNFSLKVNITSNNVYEEQELFNLL